MGLFNRRVAAPSVAKDLNPAEQERARALWRLTALPREEFDVTYGEMLARYRRRIAAGRGPEWSTVWNRAMTCAIAALKVRQARIVPRFAPAEDAARLAEAMSFALAACVFAERFAPVLGRARAPAWSALTRDAPPAAVLDDVSVSDVFGALLFARLTGDAGLDWLGQQPEALRAVAAYFGSGPSELREIADEGASRIGDPIARPQAGASTPGTSGTGRLGREREEPGSSCESTSNTSPAAGQQDREAEGGAPAPAASDPEPAPAAADASEPVAAGSEEAPETGLTQQEGPAVVGGEAGGWEWINWVRRGLFDGSIAANAKNGWLHNIGGKAFVMVPDGFDAFAAADTGESKKVRNRVTKLRRHDLRVFRGLKQDEFRAHLEDGRKAMGMMFPGDLFWDENPPPMSNSALDRRNR